MKLSLVFTYLAAFVVGCLSQTHFDAWLAPYFGPKALGPHLSTAFACCLGIALVLSVTTDKLKRVSAWWDAKSLSYGAMSLFVLGFLTLLYSAETAMQSPSVFPLLRMVAIWSMVTGTLCMVAGAIFCARAMFRASRISSTHP